MKIEWMYDLIIYNRIKNCYFSVTPMSSYIIPVVLLHYCLGIILFLTFRISVSFFGGSVSKLEYCII